VLAREDGELDGAHPASSAQIRTQFVSGRSLGEVESLPHAAVQTRQLGDLQGILDTFGNNVEFMVLPSSMIARAKLAFSVSDAMSSMKDLSTLSTSMGKLRR
jgi:hypothetical protein